MFSYLICRKTRQQKNRAVKTAQSMVKKLIFLGIAIWHDIFLYLSLIHIYITPDKMYDIHLPVSLKEIGRAAFCNAANIYTKEANLNTVRAGIRSSGASLGHGCDFWKLHIEGLQPIVMPKEIDSINAVSYTHLILTPDGGKGRNYEDFSDCKIRRACCSGNQ